MAARYFVSLRGRSIFALFIPNSRYNIVSISDYTCKVVSGDAKYKGDIVIPADLTYKSKTLKVTEIGMDAFSYCTSLTSVVIPDSVTYIGVSAFSDCSSLEDIRLSNSMERLNYGTFYNCKSLNSITIPGNINKLIQYYRYSGSFYDYIFGNCSNLKEIGFEYGEEKITGCYNNNSDVLETDIVLWSRENIFLLLEKVFIDRELSNSLELPYLKELILGEHVTNVQIKTEKSNVLETLKCYAITPPECPEFTNVQYMNLAVRVPYEALEAYQKAKVWKNFWNLEGFDPSDATVEGVNSDKSISEIGRFDINGRRVTSNYEGLVIVRYSDGTTRKILNK